MGARRTAVGGRNSRLALDQTDKFENIVLLFRAGEGGGGGMIFSEYDRFQRARLFTDDSVYSDMAI